MTPRLTRTLCRTGYCRSSRTTCWRTAMTRSPEYSRPFSGSCSGSDNAARPLSSSALWRPTSRPCDCWRYPALPGNDQILLLAARYAEYAGWLAQESGDVMLARRWTDGAFYMTDDYFDSFWTSSELLLFLWLYGWGGYRAKPVGRKSKRPGWHQVTYGGFARSTSSSVLTPFMDGMSSMSIPGLKPDSMDRLAKLINNCDPLTAAPETQVPPSGPAKVLARAVRRLGYYDPEFVANDFWNTVRVPCPVCKPRHRAPRAVDWEAHMSLADFAPNVDYFGYFPASRGNLESGIVSCPVCHTILPVVNQRGVRTLWIPIMTTERDQDRPVIKEDKVWEVQVR